MSDQDSKLKNKKTKPLLPKKLQKMVGRIRKGLLGVGGKGGQRGGEISLSKRVHSFTHSFTEYLFSTENAI